MPELPDVAVYVEAIEARCGDQVLEGIRVAGPSLLRTVEPPLSEVFGRRVTGLRRMGKRIVFTLENDLFLVVHLMIAGRFHWSRKRRRRAQRGGAERSRTDARARPRARGELAAFDFAPGTLLLTEAGTKKRASLHLVQGREALAQLDPGGLEVLECDAEAFRERLLSANHTLKRALTDPRLFSGIGNAYSDEILHRARLSPVVWTTRLEESEIDRLFRATRETLEEWTDRLRTQAGDDFPERVTAFRQEMAVHGRFRKPCPDCGAPVQRIVYASNETNYCAPCQTGGRLLADRALSRLLKKDWPRSLEELERTASAKGARSEPQASAVGKSDEVS